MGLDLLPLLSGLRHHGAPSRKGTLEVAAAIAGLASTRATQLYDRRRELVEPDDIERIGF